MKYNKKLVLLIALISTIISVGCTQDEGNDHLEDLSGVWYRDPHPEKTVKTEMSWGSAKYIPNFSLRIDGCANKPILFLPVMGGPFPIKSVKVKRKDTFEFVFYFDRGNFDVSLLIHMLDNNSFWVEQLTPQGQNPFLPTGKDRIYYRIDGPNMK
ncbi:hypothetical protein [Spirochaeta cellobiosiphila]|uniref:hypothetical protein n=1 Tax=Spirochaeta cellobiosiphila TaxID=504483 RepID=UPI00040AFF76|nr:hypothetical protein [Spirochaeta cellobiosiphila]